MLIPHLHFGGDCQKAIALYEKAFHTKAETILYGTCRLPGRGPVDHAAMKIHGQEALPYSRLAVHF